MKFMRLLTYGMFSVLFGAASCAAYQPPPLTALHPAHPGGAPAPAAPRSMTLAYSAVDKPMARTTAAAADHSEHHAAPAQDSISAEGSVVAVVPSASQLVVQHGEIKGFMDAMTMGYRVEPSSLLDGLKFGDKIRFTIDVAKKAIVKIERVK